MAVGPLLFVAYGVGSGPMSGGGWTTLLAMGLLLGAFIAALVTVNSCREKKNKSLTQLELDVRGLTERELSLVFVLIGAIVGVLFARVLDTPLMGYPICAFLFALVGLARRQILQIAP